MSARSDGKDSESKESSTTQVKSGEVYSSDESDEERLSGWSLTPSSSCSDDEDPKPPQLGIAAGAGRGAVVRPAVRLSAMTLSRQPPRKPPLVEVTKRGETKPTRRPGSSQ